LKATCHAEPRTSVLPTTDGREIRLRRVTEPDGEQKSLLRQLGISLPEHFQLNRKM